MSEPRPPRLFFENGASWYWVLAGPLAAVFMLWMQSSSGYGLQPLVPGVFLVLVSAFVALQVKAARIHTSVELTEHTLRQGTETIRVDDISMVYPQPAQRSRRAEPTEKWQEARTLGELNRVPRGRAGIGLQLSGGRTAQAWARNHRALRAALTSLVQQRTGDTGRPEPSSPGGDGDSGATGSQR